MDSDVLATIRKLLHEASQPKTVEEQLASTRARIASLRHRLERSESVPPEPPEGAPILISEDPFWLKVMLGFEESHLSELERQS